MTRNKACERTIFVVSVFRFGDNMQVTGMKCD